MLSSSVSARDSNRCVLEVFALIWLGSTPLAFAADAGATARLSQRWDRLAGAGERLVSRELFWFAEVALENRSHAAEIEQAYAWAEEMQLHTEHFDKLAHKLPQKLLVTKAELEKRLGT